MSEAGSIPATKAKARPRAWILWLLAGVIVVLLYFGIAYLIEVFTHESTDDAFIAGHIVSVSSRIAGPVTSVLVKDNQLIHSNDLLWELDPADFTLTVALKTAAAESQSSNYKTILAAYQLMETKVTTAKAASRRAQDDADAAAATAQKSRADFERATKISGAGFYFLKGNLVLLDLALQRFALDLLAQRGFTPILPPFMINRSSYEGVTDLDDFENVMYKIDGDDAYLIATSEHPIGAMYRDEIFEEKDLPLRLAGISSCFRREIGSHGLDTKGLFRVHQFSKVEQFVFCRPEDSWQIHEELLANAEEVFHALGLPYRVVNICTGDIGTVAAKKYDIEVWMPRENAYKEVVSCSNCTAYQAVRLNILVRDKENFESKRYVHTLNSTAIATSRAMRAILENCQEKDGSVVIPPVLRKYMNDQEYL